MSSSPDDEIIDQEGQQRAAGPHAVVETVVWSYRPAAMPSIASAFIAASVSRRQPHAGPARGNGESRPREFKALGRAAPVRQHHTFNYPTLAEAYKIAGLDAWNRMGQG